MNEMDRLHPIQTLLFMLDCQIQPQHAGQVRAAVEGLASKRSKWVLGAPVFIDSTEISITNDRHGDQPIRTLGGELQIYSAVPPWSNKLPKEIDRQHYEEVNLIVQHMRQFSEATGLTLGFELDGVSVGWIKAGKLDKMLEIGLLAEWKKSVGVP